MDFTNFYEKTGTNDYEKMYGKIVYVTIFPKKKNRYIYQGTLLGYGAYGKDPEHKTFCVFVDRGDGYHFIDYFLDACFCSEEEYQNYKEHAEKTKDYGVTVGNMMKVCQPEEKHIPVRVKMGNMVYPVIGYAEQPKREKLPAFVIKADYTKREPWIKAVE